MTWEKVSKEFFGRLLDRVRVKGKNKAVPIYEVMGKGECPKALSEDLILWEKAQESFCHQAWSESQSIFEMWHQKYDDKTAAIYLALLEEYRRRPPGPDWQPISIISSK
jgi:adenylate cyclase